MWLLYWLSLRNYFLRILSRNFSLSPSPLLFVLVSAIFVRSSKLQIFYGIRAKIYGLNNTNWHSTICAHITNSNSHYLHSFHVYTFNLNTITIAQAWLHQLYPMEASVNHYPRGIFPNSTHWWYNFKAITFCSWCCMKCNFSC